MACDHWKVYIAYIYHFQAIGLLKNVLEGRVVCKLHTDSWPSFNTMVCEVIYPRVSEVQYIIPCI